MFQVEVGVGVRSRIAPPGRMDGDRSHDGAKMKLLCHVERSLREFRHITRFTHLAPDRFGLFGPCGRRDLRNRSLVYCATNRGENRIASPRNAPESTSTLVGAAIPPKTNS